MTIHAAPSTSFTAYLIDAPAGLVGSLGVVILNAAGTAVVAHTTAGITEIEPGIYSKTFTAPASQSRYLVVWDADADGDAVLEFASEDLIVQTPEPTGEVGAPPADEPAPLIPPGDDVVAADDDLAAAAASALADVTTPAVVEPTPLGSTWLYDFDAGRLVLRGDAPVLVQGADALAVWIKATLTTGRLAHPVFTGLIGIDRPDVAIGEADPARIGELLADYERSIRDALLAHDRISAVTNYAADYDPLEGEVTVRFKVITDDQATVSVAGLTIQTEEP